MEVLHLPAADVVDPPTKLILGLRRRCSMHLTGPIASLLLLQGAFAVQDPTLCGVVVLCFTITNAPCNRQQGACPPCLYANTQGGYLCWAKRGGLCPFHDKPELTMFDCSGGNGSTEVPSTPAPVEPTTVSPTTMAAPTTALAPTTPSTTLTPTASTRAPINATIPVPATSGNNTSAGVAPGASNQTILMIAIGMGVALTFVAGICALVYRRNRRQRQPFTLTVVHEARQAQGKSSKHPRGIPVHGSALQRINSGISSQQDDLSMRSFPTPSSFGGLDTLLGPNRDDVQPHSTIHEYIDGADFAQFYPRSPPQDISDSVSDYRSTNSIVLEERYTNFSILSDDPRDNKSFLRVSWDAEADKEVEI
ncbi:hypothetical protein ACHHYP_07089 [Achlya hypogyna]|uniref:Secreted protein n=1 Tax=Achlya hypogyna TaxID=1202772 RepID=A0A1V9ZMN5_ACHHY|nr:hypothetical protein ACHHYP_07089 [Achlya hypogyna]